MCLMTEWDKPKKAHKDLVVWKWLHPRAQEYISPYRGGEYRLGVRYTVAPLRIYTVDHYPYSESLPRLRAVHAGLHAFTTKKAATEYAQSAVVNGLAGAVLMRAIVPEGAEYVLGINNTIVSTDMIIQREVGLVSDECLVSEECG